MSKGSGKLKRCPYCLKEKPREEFKQGLCADCYPEYVKQSKQWEDEALAKKIEQGEREIDEDQLYFPYLPKKDWPPPPLSKIFKRWVLWRFYLVAIPVGLFILILTLVFLFTRC